jgi:hypothetical protein
LILRDNIVGEVFRKSLIAQCGENKTFGEWIEENMTKPLAPEGEIEVWCGFRGDPKKHLACT